jgi:replicative DNA helicase
MEPGSRKSAVHRDLTAPLLEYERDLAAAARPKLADAASRRRVAEATLARLEKTIAGAGPDDRAGLELERSAAALALDKLAVPVEPRLFTADATPEALASLLFAHGGRMGVLSAEGGIFELMAGRYSNGVPNLDVFLSGHAGDLLRVDRKGRPTEYVERPALTIGVAVQPAVLRKAARVPEMSGRGLLDRFVFSLPPPNVGFRDMDPPPVPDANREAYAAMVRTLAASLDGCDGPFTLRFTPGATMVLSAWSAELEPRRRPDADLGHIQGWAAKLDGATVRIAGLLHICRHVTDGWGRPIGADTMQAAVKIGRYFVAHALAAFDYMGADPRLEAARRIARWIVATQQATFTKREAFRALRGQALFPTVERLTAGLAALDEHGWVRQIAPERGRGRPPSRYETNPAIFAEAWTKWPELARSPEPDDVLSVLSMDSERSGTAMPEPDGAAREPELWALGPVAPPEPAELGDWLTAPLRDPDEAAPDEWGTIG